MRFLARLILNGLAIIIAAWVLPGIDITNAASGLIAGIILGFVNAIVRPVLLLLTLPLTLLTLGLFIFVVNAICFGLTAWLVPGFNVHGFLYALVGALFVSVVSWILNGLVVGRRERE